MLVYGEICINLLALEFAAIGHNIVPWPLGNWYRGDYFSLLVPVYDWPSNYILQ